MIANKFYQYQYDRTREEEDFRSFTIQPIVMNNDSGIICFKHCNNKNIYCIHIPAICPVCKKCLENSMSIPIRVPYPFVRASQQPCSIVVKPTQGDFLNNYKLMDDLHIGATTSSGTVISYNWNGISEDTVNWQGCLVVFSLRDRCWETQWDALLTDIVKNDRWDNTRYDEEKHNCFSFIMVFIKRLNYALELSSMHLVKTREDFAKSHIAPITLKAHKYICLYRKIVENGFHVYAESSKEILCT